MSSFDTSLLQSQAVVIKQLHEGVELLGFEGRNRYEIFDVHGQLIGRAEEKRQGFFQMLFRQFIRHWRSFQLEISDLDGQLYLLANHPFRFYFQRIDLSDAKGVVQGAIEKQFSILSKNILYQIKIL